MKIKNSLNISKKYLRKIEEAERQMAQADALFLSIGDGVISTDDEGKIQRINKPAAEMLGYKKNELEGKWLPKIITEQDEDGNPIDPLDRQITRAFLTGKPISGKVFYKTKRRDTFAAAVNVSPTMLEDGPVGLVIVFRDITLEHEVDKMKSEFISIASHQLRTPLTAIKTYSHLIYDGYAGPIKDDQKDFLEQIINSTDTMNELITNLLNVSRIELGKFKLEVIELSLVNKLESVISELKPAANEKKVKIIFEKPDSDAVVRTDRFLAREVFTNLISNAIKYTHEGDTIRVSLEDKEDAYRFSVSDNGMGIPLAAQRKIFTKFYRAPNAIAQESDGTGLGLYLIRLIAEALKAKVWFISAEGKGSTFYFSLPKKPNFSVP